MNALSSINPSTPPAASSASAAPAPSAAAPPAADTPAPAAAAAPRSDSAAWQRRLNAAGAWIGRQLRKPRTRLAVIGVVLLLVAVLGIASSVWTLPLVIIGAAMVVIAWIGARLDGRFAIEWGESGTQFEFRAQIKAPPPPRAAIAAPAADTTPVAGGPAVRVPTLTQLDDSGDSDVIEGEAHTVEIDVAELRALILAAEAKEASVSRGGADGAIPSELRDRPAA